jgi:hypothetical protein
MVFNSVNFEDLENYLVTLGFEINNQPDKDFYTKEKRPDRITYEKKHKYISYIISFESERRSGNRLSISCQDCGTIYEDNEDYFKEKYKQKEQK